MIFSGAISSFDLLLIESSLFKYTKMSISNTKFTTMKWNMKKIGKWTISLFTLFLVLNILTLFYENCFSDPVLSTSKEACFCAFMYLLSKSIFSIPLRPLYCLAVIQTSPL